MAKKVFEKTLILPAGLIDVRLERPAPPGAARDVDMLLLAEKARQAKAEREEVQRVLQNLSTAAQALHQQHEDAVKDMQRLTVELAVAISSTLLHERVRAGDYSLNNLVQKVIERLDTSQPVTVYLHPEDLLLLRKRMGEGQVLFPENTEVQLAADPTLARAGVRAEAGDISVSADLEDQLADIHRALQEALPAA